jgi:hypothetical protein
MLYNGNVSMYIDAMTFQHCWLVDADPAFAYFANYYGIETQVAMQLFGCVASGELLSPGDRGLGIPGGSPRLQQTVSCSGAGENARARRQNLDLPTCQGCFRLLYVYMRRICK